MNKIITILFLTGLVFACKPKSEDIQPIVEVKCKKLTYTIFNSKTNQLLGKITYIYDKTDKLIEVQGSNGNSSKYEYDAQDNLLKVTDYSKNQGFETKTSETLYTYNTANQIIRWVTNTISDQIRTEKKSEYLYEYHANGKLKKWTWFDYTMVYNKPYIVTEHDENGNEISTTFHDGFHIKKEYNAANLIIKSTDYDDANNATYETLFEYNSQNKCIKRSTYHNGVLSSYTTYEYNAKGQQISFAIYKANGALSMREIKEYKGESFTISNYDDQNKLTSYSTIEVQNGLMMKDSFYRDNKLVFYTIYAYDIHKNMLKQEEFNEALEEPLRREWTYQCD